MCGICGVYGKDLIKPEIQAFETLFHVSALRGMDSSGMFGLHKGEGKVIVSTIKSIQTSTEFMYNQEEVLNKYYQDKKPFVLVGHCRWATQGKIYKKNAHPFIFDNIIGVHNGTITTFIPHRNDFETDSETLYHNINKDGIEHTIKNLGHHGVAYTLVYFDKKKQTLNFIRNRERPLFMCVTNFNSLYWASEKEFLEFSLDRAKQTIVGEIVEMKEDTLISYKVGERDAIANPIMIDLKPKPFVYDYSTRNRMWEETFSYTDKGDKRASNVISLPPLPPQKKVHGQAVSMFRWKNSWGSAAEVDKLLAKGCSWCTDTTLDHKEFDKIWWTSDSEFVCTNCTQNNKELEDMVTGLGGVKGVCTYNAYEMNKEAQLEIEQERLKKSLLNDPLPKHMMH